MANLGSGTTSTRNLQQGSNLVNKIRMELESLNAFSFPEYSICKVPDPLRKLNPDAYTPQFVSIGPFHHGNKALQTLEKFKVKYLKDFLKHCKPSLGLEDLVRIIEDSEIKLCRCYAETSPLSRDDFVKMILVDASFIIELFYRYWRKNWTYEDRILLKPWIFDRIMLDLLLIENQLPFFIIEKLFDCVSLPPTHPRLMDLTFRYFSSFNTQNLHSNSMLEIKHFVDLLRNFYLRPLQNNRETIRRRAKHMYSVTQLYSKGLKFNVNEESECLLDIGYDSKMKTLKMPEFRLNFYTEPCAGNVIALEQCLYPNEEYFTDYFILLSFLIQSEADVILLGEKGIILNELGNNDATFINRLSASSRCSRMSSEYYDLCIGLVEFYQKPSHGWKATLIRDYLSTPMKAAATFTAILLLILTLIQTVCSILQVK